MARHQELQDHHREFFREQSLAALFGCDQCTQEVVPGTPTALGDVPVHVFGHALDSGIGFLPSVEAGQAGGNVDRFGPALHLCVVDLGNAQHLENDLEGEALGETLVEIDTAALRHDVGEIVSDAAHHGSQCLHPARSKRPVDEAPEPRVGRRIDGDDVATHPFDEGASLPARALKGPCSHGSEARIREGRGDVSMPKEHLGAGGRDMSGPVSVFQEALGVATGFEPKFRVEKIDLRARRVVRHCTAPPVGAPETALSIRIAL